MESEPVIAEPKRVVINSIKSQNTISILGMTASDYVDKVALEHPTFAASIKKYGLTIIKEASKYPRLKDHIPLIFAQVEQESSRKDYALNNK